MNRNILVIYESTSPNLSISIRHKHIIQYLLSRYDCKIYDISTSTRVSALGKYVDKIYNGWFSAPQSWSIKQYQVKRQIQDILSKEKYTNVVILVKPFYLMKLAKYIKLYDRDVNVICDMSDPYSQNVGLLSARAGIHKKIKKYEDSVARYIDHLSVLNEEIRIHYSRIFSDVFVVDQGLANSILRYDHSSLKPMDSECIKMVYAGKFYRGIREPFELYHALDELDNVRLKIYNQQNSEQWLPKNKKNIKICGGIEHAKLLQEYKKADIIVFIDNFVGIQVPGKTLEILATGLPILFIYASDNTPTLHYMKEHKGVYYARNNSDSIVSAINEFTKEGKQYWKRKVSQYSWKNLVQRYDKVLVKKTYNKSIG